MWATLPKYAATGPKLTEEYPHRYGAKALCSCLWSAGQRKTHTCTAVGSALNLPMIDKDEILDRLFESKGVGDAKWRRALSLESDMLFQEEALSLDGFYLANAGQDTCARSNFTLATRTFSTRCGTQS
jgi:hypothetical protein